MSTLSNLLWQQNKIANPIHAHHCVFEWCQQSMQYNTTGYKIMVQVHHLCSRILRITILQNLRQSWQKNKKCFYTRLYRHPYFSLLVLTFAPSILFSYLLVTLLCDAVLLTPSTSTKPRPMASLARPVVYPCTQTVSGESW